MVNFKNYFIIPAKGACQLRYVLIKQNERSINRCAYGERAPIIYIVKIIKCNYNEGEVGWQTRNVSTKS